jgi:hypothetical protein
MRLYELKKIVDEAIARHGENEPFDLELDGADQKAEFDIDSMKIESYDGYLYLEIVSPDMIDHGLF